MEGRGLGRRRWGGGAGDMAEPSASGVHQATGAREGPRAPAGDTPKKLPGATAHLGADSSAALDLTALPAAFSPVRQVGAEPPKKVTPKEGEEQPVGWEHQGKP